MSPNLPNPVSAPRDKTNRNQYIEGRGRVTGRFSKVGFSYSVSKTITAAPVPTIHSLPFHVRRCRPFSNKSAQIQSTHGGRAYHKDSCRCCRTAIYPRRQLCRSWPRWCDDEDEQMHDFSSCARISAKADTGVSRRRSAQIKTHGSCQSPIAQGSWPESRRHVTHPRHSQAEASHVVVRHFFDWPGRNAWRYRRSRPVSS
jgi:hypothetical protein